MMNEPLIFDIRHFVLDDGPGIRSTVFLKGCNLSCRWCHNPEGIKKSREIIFYAEHCTGCGSCRSVCPEGAVDMYHEHRIIREKCTLCGMCETECPSRALRIIGKYYSPDELVKILLSDKVFYLTSGGGVTFSGGEPTLFMDYLNVVCKKLKENNIHIAIQTSGTFDFERFREKLLPFLDLIYFDMKLSDKSEYRLWTGGDPALPFNNFKRLCRLAGISIIASIPLIPGITSTFPNLNAIKMFLMDAGCNEYIFRPYHTGGIEKNKRLGNKVPGNMPEKPLNLRDEKTAKQIFYEETQLR